MQRVHLLKSMTDFSGQLHVCDVREQDMCKSMNARQDCLYRAGAGSGYGE